MPTITDNRVLSVRQPFADQILTPRPKQPHLPLKWVENRSWSTEHRGRLYIHASGRHRTLPTGVILGHVTLVEIIEPRPDPAYCRKLVCTAYHNHDLKSPSPDWQHAGVNYDAAFWWLLAHPVRLDTPVQAKGQLRLWSF